MNRTLRVERWPVTGVQRGEIQVATTITHPERGLVNCPAALLLVASLRRGQPDALGRRVRLAEATVITEAISAFPNSHHGSHGPQWLPAASEASFAAPSVGSTPQGILVMASYVDRAGRVTGLGAAARADDGAAMTACTELVSQWAAVLRSRRLLVAGADPDCAGARASVAAALRAAACEGAVYMLGRPVVSVGELGRLAEAGVRIVTDLDEVPDSAVVVFPAHGVPLPVRAEVAARGLRVVDATCPLAASVHRDITTYADRGDTVVLMTGTQQSAGEPVSVAQAPESVLPVRKVADVPDPRQSWIAPDRLSVVVQTGLPIEDATAMISVLRSRFPLVRGQHYDALCYAATDRAAAVKQIAAPSDLVLVLGDAADPDATDMQAEAAAAVGPGQSGTAASSAVHAVAAVADIESGWLAGVDTIGVVQSRSARPGLVTEVCDALSGLGPLSVVNRQVRTSHGQTQTWVPIPDPEPASA